MPEGTIEISQEKFESLQRATNLLDSLWNDKDKGLEFKRMVKEKVPTARVPELDLIDAVTKPRDEKMSKLEEMNKKLSDRLDAWETKELNSKEESEFRSELNGVRTKYKFTDEGMQKVINRMQEKKNPDAEAAAAWVLSQEPKSSPTAPSNAAGFPTKANLYGVGKQDDEWKELNQDPVAFADKEIMNILSNPEQYRELGGTL